MLQLTNLLKKYNDQVILDIPSFELQQGIYWLKGANGSGKSTLLKIIAGLIPFEGDVVCNEISLCKNAVAFKNIISYNPADAALPPFITGLELIQFYNAIRNTNTTNEIDFIIEKFQLAHYVKNKIGSYSSGMQKKLSLALAFISAPKLIMLDEPLSTLDVETTKLITEVIDEYHKKGSSFIITSHQDFEYSNITFTNELLISTQAIHIVK
jgi:ABC-2 type transport system ATP-binding protein